MSIDREHSPSLQIMTCVASPSICTLLTIIRWDDRYNNNTNNKKQKEQRVREIQNTHIYIEKRVSTMEYDNVMTTPLTEPPLQQQPSSPNRLQQQQRKYHSYSLSSSNTTPTSYNRTIPTPTSNRSNPCNATNVIIETNNDDDNNATNNNNNNNNRSMYHHPQHPIMNTIHLFLSPFVDETGSFVSIVFGMIGLIVTGTMIGLSVSFTTGQPSSSSDDDNNNNNPDDPNNPNSFSTTSMSLSFLYQHYISTCIGYIYVLCWSISFYPQIIMNYKNQHTNGLSIDFCILNVIGFLFYTIYNVNLYYNPIIQHMFYETYGPNAIITVQFNDVVFAIHAFALSCVTIGQIIWYNYANKNTPRRSDDRITTNGNNNIIQIDPNRHRRPSKLIVLAIALVATISVVYPILILARTNRSTGTTGTTVTETNHTVDTTTMNWLQYIYLLSYMKIAISLIKYIPQVLFNYQRQSTEGWSIWNIVLDFFGGTFSILQLVGYCAVQNNYTAITHNLAKFGLGFVSIMFDVIFMFQHYVLYNKNDHSSNDPTTNNSNTNDNDNNTIDETNTNEQRSLLQNEEDDSPSPTTTWAWV